MSKINKSSTEHSELVEEGYIPNVKSTRLAEDKALSPKDIRSLKLRDQLRAAKAGKSIERCTADPNVMRRIDTHSDKHRRQCLEKQTNETDELVKHMSSIPGYLQHIGRGYDLQGKALNFGVLEWGNLEKWMYKHKPMVGARDVASPSSSYASSSTTASSARSHRSPAARESFCQSERSCRSDKSPSTIGQFVGRNSIERMSAKQNRGNPASKSACNQRCEPHEWSDCSLEPKDDGVILVSADVESNACKGGEQHQSVGRLSSENFNLPQEGTLIRFRNITTKSPHRPASNAGLLTEENHGIFSGNRISGDTHSGPRFNEVPLPSHLPCKIQSKEQLKFKSPSVTTSQHGKLFELGYSDRLYRRDASPNCRFITDSNNRSRSSSFRLSPVGKKLSNSTSFPDASSREKATSSGRSRQSPLRRLLDPLLKPRGSNRIHLDNEPGHAQKPVLSREEHNSDPSSPFIKTRASVQDEKAKASKNQALLKVTWKNGLPLFTLTFGSDILAGTRRTGKDDCEWVYTFYSVCEVKKRSGGWINQKNKNCGYQSNIVGHMKVKLTNDGDRNNHMDREFVLYTADQSEEANETTCPFPYTESAAIIIKASTEMTQRTESESHGMNKQSLSEVVVILPIGVHSFPATGKPSPLIERWKSGGTCDCGGWDVSCKLTVLNNQIQDSEALDPVQSHRTAENSRRVDLFIKGGRGQEDELVFSMAGFKDVLYVVDFDACISLTQAFAICIAMLHDVNTVELSKVHKLEEIKLREPTSMGSHYRRASSSTQETSSVHVPYPPLSPVGRA
ncbi:hypothetical protein QJS10_CPB14g00799 [Acorus calamus]|uniref:Uncharacterized protein n=1 Tax=Acorus calamus TaxID=4465 RepID=A0AAV9DG83_ACOCL|nr:hypothetical protein QJS10_CPB14g00799 [Acorus calamus]